MINFFNIDNVEFMKQKPDNSYDLAIVDPPYGIDIAKWDAIDMKPSREYFKELFRVSKNQIIWGGNYFELPHSEGWICWDKTFKCNQKLAVGEFELAWTSLNIKHTFLRYTSCGNFQGWEKPKADYDKKKSFHPTSKPIDVYRWLLQKYAEPNYKILDTHGGSMTIAKACDMEGFDLDICEIDKTYFEQGKADYLEYKRQPKLF